MWLHWFCFKPRPEVLGLWSSLKKPEGEKIGDMPVELKVQCSLCSFHHSFHRRSVDKRNETRLRRPTLRLILRLAPLDDPADLPSSFALLVFRKGVQ